MSGNRLQAIELRLTNKANNTNSHPNYVLNIANPALEGRKNCKPEYPEKNTQHAPLSTIFAIKRVFLYDLL